MAIAVARHVESVTESGATSAAVTRQGVMESHRICHREWSRIVVVKMAYQGVMELRRVRRREWSSVVRYCGLPGGLDLSAEVRLESVARSGSRRSPNGAYQQLKLVTEQIGRAHV